MQKLIEPLRKYKIPVLDVLLITFSILTLWIFAEYLAGLASVLWPIIVGATIIGFRHELSDLLKRIKRVSKEGMEFQEAQIAAQMISVPVSEALKDVAPNEDHSDLIKNKVESIRHELNSRLPEDVVKREHLLILRLVEAQQVRDFQFVWLNIFLSQLEALTRMAAGTDSVDLMNFFEIHQSRVDAQSSEPPLKPSFEGWSGFLVRMQLIVVNDTSGEITPQGREFLNFTNRHNLPRFQGL